MISSLKVFHSLLHRPPSILEDVYFSVELVLAERDSKNVMVCFFVFFVCVLQKVFMVPGVPSVERGNLG